MSVTTLPVRTSKDLTAPSTLPAMTSWPQVATEVTLSLKLRSTWMASALLDLQSQALQQGETRSGRVNREGVSAPSERVRGARGTNERSATMGGGSNACEVVWLLTHLKVASYPPENKTESFVSLAKEIAFTFFES